MICKEALDVTHEWGQKSGLFFNPCKTQAICFNRKRQKNQPDLPKLHLGDGCIEWVERVKYLGVTMTPRLDW